MRERRPRLLQDEGEHRQEHGHHQADERAEPELGALVLIDCGLLVLEELLVHQRISDVTP